MKLEEKAPDLVIGERVHTLGSFTLVGIEENGDVRLRWAANDSTRSEQFLVLPRESICNSCRISYGVNNSAAPSTSKAQRKIYERIRGHDRNRLKRN